LIPAGSSARLITKFEDFADDTVPYMYHCHMLKHEDSIGGMMGQFVVIDPTASVDDFDFKNGFSLYPNPSNRVYMTAKLNNPSEKIIAYAVVNQLGQIISYQKIHENELSNLYSFPVFEYSAGTYILKIFTDNAIYTNKFLVK
jgi:bilirubin oxidase